MVTKEVGQKLRSQYEKNTGETARRISESDNRAREFSTGYTKWLEQKVEKLSSANKR